MLTRAILIALFSLSLAVPAMGQSLRANSVAPVRISALMPAILQQSDGTYRKAEDARARTMRKSDWLIFAILTALLLAAGLLLSQQIVRSQNAGNGRAVSVLMPLVWVNLRSGIYYSEGSRWYRTTKEGRLMSISFAKNLGYRAYRK